MSRESDIKALKHLKDEISEMESLMGIADEELEKYKKCENELNNTKFVFKPLPTNQEKTLRAQFKQAWKTRMENTNPFRIIFLVLYSLAVLAFTVVLALDFFHNSCNIIRQPHQYTQMPEQALMALLPLVFGGSIAVLPWCFLSWDNLFGFTKGTLITCGISGVVFAVACDWTSSMHLLLVYIGCGVAGIVISFVIHLICLILSKIPMYGPKKQAQLKAAKQSDRDNAQENIQKEIRDKADWDAWWATRQEELKGQLNHHANMANAAAAKAKEHLAVYESIDILAEDEKNTEVANWLLYFIETHRADSIKEALHEYDNMLQNKKMLELEAMKLQLEITKAEKENADRQHQLDMQRRHQLEMEAQAARTAASQASIAASTAAMRDSMDRMRRDAAFNASLAADTQEQIAADMAAIRRNNYYNS